MEHEKPKGLQYLGDVLGSLRYMGQCPCGSQHMSTHAKVLARGHIRYCEPCGRKILANELAETRRVYAEAEARWFSVVHGTPASVAAEIEHEYESAREALGAHRGA